MDCNKTCKGLGLPAAKFESTGDSAEKKMTLDSKVDLHVLELLGSEGYEGIEKHDPRHVKYFPMLVSTGEAEEEGWEVVNEKWVLVSKESAATAGFDPTLLATHDLATQVLTSIGRAPDASAGKILLDERLKNPPHSHVKKPEFNIVAESEFIKAHLKDWTSAEDTEWMKDDIAGVEIMEVKSKHTQDLPRSLFVVRRKQAVESYKIEHVYIQLNKKNESQLSKDSTENSVKMLIDVISGQWAVCRRAKDSVENLRLAAPAKMLARCSKDFFDRPDFLGHCRKKDGKEYFFTIRKLYTRDADTLRCEAKSWSEEKKCNFVRRLVESVQFLHGKKLVHGDIKPANILLDEQDTPVLSDFGYATNRLDETFTPGNWRGTPAFMPENPYGVPLKQLDKFALGQTLDEIFSLNVYEHDLTFGLSNRLLKKISYDLRWGGEYFEFGTILEALSKSQ